MLTLIAAAFTVASVFLAGRKNIWAWPLGLAGAVLWVWFALDIGDTGVLLMNAFFCLLYVYNFITWKGFTMPTLFGQAARVKREKGRIRRRLRESEEAQLASQQLADEGFFRRFEQQASPGASPEHCQDTFAVERDDSLREGHFAPCEVCGCTLLMRDSFQVFHVASDFHRFLVGHPAPRHEDVLPFDIKFYCKQDKLPYDRVVYVYQRGGCLVPVAGGVLHVEAPEQFTATVYREFFKRTMTDDEYINMKNAHGAAFTPTGPWQQVTEDGEQYD